MADDKFVQGIRHRSWTPVGVILRVTGTLCFLAPFWWIVELIRHASYRFNDGLMATIGLTVVFIILFIIGVLALSSWEGYFSKTVIESECPACGTRAKRDYNERATNCSACIAYLRADGNRIREERLDAENGSYMVSHDRLLPALKRDEQDHVVLKMPAMCATCGAPDPKHQKAIYRMTDASLPGSGVIGAVASEVAYQAMSRESRAKAGLWGPTGAGPYKSLGDAPPNELDSALEEVKFLVCETHAKQQGFDLITCYNGNLWFRSYRYYKEFLAENYIDGPVTRPR